MNKAIITLGAALTAVAFFTFAKPSLAVADTLHVCAGEGSGLCLAVQGGSSPFVNTVTQPNAQAVAWSQDPICNGGTVSTNPPCPFTDASLDTLYKNEDIIHLQFSSGFLGTEPGVWAAAYAVSLGQHGTELVCDGWGLVDVYSSDENFDNGNPNHTNGMYLRSTGVAGNKAIYGPWASGYAQWGFVDTANGETADCSGAGLL